MNITTLMSIIEFIGENKTGTPHEFSKKVKISERMLYKYIELLKQEFNAPVKYDKTLKTYYFSENGTLNLRWKPKKIQTEIGLQ
jgi:predicted DNA-binding transcriptional regulator YafY